MAKKNAVILDNGKKAILVDGDYIDTPGFSWTVIPAGLEFEIPVNRQMHVCEIEIENGAELCLEGDLVLG